MIRTLTFALALALALPACAAPRLVRVPMNIQAVTLDRHAAGRSSEMVLAREDVDVQIVGALALLTVHQVWRYDGTWQSPGDEASQRVRASHLSAFYDYWITEDGKRHEGLVRDRRSAKAAYAANLANRRDPGLVEWVDEGVYDLRLYPVLNGGRTKDQGFKLLTVLPVRAGGEMVLRWHLPVYAVEKGTLTLRAAPGSQFTDVTTNVHLQGDETRLSGKYGGFESGEKVIEVRLRTPDVTASVGNLSWYGENGRRFLQMTGAGKDDAFQACLADKGAEHAVAGFLGTAQADDSGTPVPDAWLARLTASAHALRLDLDEDRAAEAMGTLAGARVVGPGVVLYADPAQTAQQVQAGWEAALEQAPGSVPLPAAPSMLSQLDFEVPTGLAVPTFKAARERANGRACFANQKTLVGAIEMYSLDKNLPLGTKLFRFHGYRKHATAPAATGPTLRPPAGVEVSYWRGPERMLAYRVARGLPPVDGPWSPADVSASSDYQWTRADAIPEAVTTPPWLFKELKDGGYLQSIPWDPGFGPNSEHNYWLTSTGDGIVCVNHGFIKGERGTSAREQLARAGYGGEVLTRANTEIVANGPSRRTPFNGWLVLLAAMTVASALLYLVIGLASPAARSWERIEECVSASIRGLLWALPALIIGPLVLLPLFYAALRAGQAAGASAARVMAHLTRG